MHSFTFLATIFATATAAQEPLRVPKLITKDWILNHAQNNSLFTKWRPRSHFIAPAGWMNHPCGAVYDPATDLYHLHYQFHPNHVNWGGISWGHAVSKDLFHWSDIRDWRDDSSVSLPAGKFKNGPPAFFSGSSVAVNLQGKQDGTLLAFATRAQILPTSWKKPYIKGMELQTMFRSRDAGRSWQELGVIIDGPPKDWSVTGFRDPYVFPSPGLDAIRGVGPHYYLTLGSGLKGPNVPDEFPDDARPGLLGSRIALYTAPASDLTKWTFVGPVWESAPNASLGNPDITGGYGYNFETSGIFDLPTNRNGGGKGPQAWFAIMGTEGGNTTLHPDKHWAVWSRGDISTSRGGSVKLTPSSSGALDWGIAYSHTSFVDQRKGNGNRRIMWGWADDDVYRPPYSKFEWHYHVLKALGYSGVMGMPLELFVKNTPGLQKHKYIDGNEWIPDARNAYTAETLGIRPLPDVVKQLISGAKQQTSNVGNLQPGTGPKKIFSHVGDSWMMTATLGPVQRAAGIIIAQSPDNAEYTKIIYDAQARQIRVLRENSTLLKGVFKTNTLTGYFAPYTFANGTTEDVKFTLIFDKSLLEIFVNDRFALTTRIYPVRPDSTGISYFAADLHGNGHVDNASVAPWKQATVWMGLKNAWPKRPDNSSSKLVWDSPEQTGGYKWWSGW